MIIKSPNKTRNKPTSKAFSENFDKIFSKKVDESVKFRYSGIIEVNRYGPSTLLIDDLKEDLLTTKLEEGKKYKITIEEV